MRVPGVAWTALIVALTGVLGGWLTDYITQPWVPLVMILLSGIAKAAEIYLAKPDMPNTVLAPTRSLEPVRFNWRGFLLG